MIARVARVMAPKVPEVEKWVFQYVIGFRDRLTKYLATETTSICPKTGVWVSA